MLVILNDNEMSISENVGALNNHRRAAAFRQVYTTLREGGKSVLPACRQSRDLLKKTEEHIKGMVVLSTFFEELGLQLHRPRGRTIRCLR